MGQRPAHVKPPAYLSANPPVPQPEGLGGPTKKTAPTDEKAGAQDPVRYGDWERRGIAVDF